MIHDDPLSGRPLLDWPAWHGLQARLGRPAGGVRTKKARCVAAATPGEPERARAPGSLRKPLRPDVAPSHPHPRHRHPRHPPRPRVPATPTAATCEVERECLMAPAPLVCVETPNKNAIKPRGSRAYPRPPYPLPHLPGKPPTPIRGLGRAGRGGAGWAWPGGVACKFGATAPFRHFPNLALHLPPGLRAWRSAGLRAIAGTVTRQQGSDRRRRWRSAPALP